MAIGACQRPPDGGELPNGVFRFGSEWHGTYSTILSDGRVGKGALELQVVGVNGATVTLLGYFYHGE
jgi:hypothetical protein